MKEMRGFLETKEHTPGPQQHMGYKDQSKNHIEVEPNYFFDNEGEWNSHVGNNLS